MASGSSRGNSSEKEAAQYSDKEDKKNDIEGKNKVMRERDKRKLEEREKIEKALQQIRLETYLARQKAQEKEFSQYRPSSGMKSSFGQPNAQGSQPATQPSDPNEAETKPKKVEEAYSMEDEDKEHHEGTEEEQLPDITEEIDEENASDNEEIKQDKALLRTMKMQADEMRQKLYEKTQRIEKEMSKCIEEESGELKTPLDSEESIGKDKDSIEKKPITEAKIPDKEKKETKENALEEIIEHMESDSEGEIEKEEEEVKTSTELPIESLSEDESRKICERIKLLKQ